MIFYSLIFKKKIIQKILCFFYKKSICINISINNNHKERKKLFKKIIKDK